MGEIFRHAAVERNAVRILQILRPCALDDIVIARRAGGSQRGIDRSLRHVHRVGNAGFNRVVNPALQVVADEITGEREDQQHRQHPAYADERN
ncbi:hypothetical protein SDC9_165163 [bioreactor metagenome]|uniref:Uncharacterized protein n=1 Tax=bioreactor metagenome TaxID=1076179 RepID=A0A645FTM8_9ZZZZ